MLRQFWLFMTADDEPALLAAIDAVDPGTVVLGGRYVRGEMEGVLARGPAGLEFPALTAREARRYLFHHRHSAALVAPPVTEGPLVGARAIDESRSDCLMLVRPEPDLGRLAPARLSAEIVRFARDARDRKPHAFIGWVNRVLRALRARYPRTAVDFMHVAPGALALADGGGELSYLHQRIAPRPP